MGRCGAAGAARGRVPVLSTVEGQRAGSWSCSGEIIHQAAPLARSLMPLRFTVCSSIKQSLEEEVQAAVGAAPPH